MVRPLVESAFTTFQAAAASSAQTPASWRTQRKLCGSGAHGDLNAHLIDMTLFLTGLAHSFGYAFAMRLLTGLGPLVDIFPMTATGCFFFCLGIKAGTTVDADSRRRLWLGGLGFVLLLALLVWPRSQATAPLPPAAVPR